MTRRGHRDEAPGEERQVPRASTVDPAASMSLLTSLLANPLDAGYEHYHADHSSHPARCIEKLAVFVVAAALGFGQSWQRLVCEGQPVT